VPKLLEAAICVFMRYVRTGERLFPDEPTTFTCCQEKIGRAQATVGNFASNGLSVNSHYTNLVTSTGDRIVGSTIDNYYGVAACRSLGSS